MNSMTNGATTTPPSSPVSRAVIRPGMIPNICSLRSRPRQLDVEDLALGYKKSSPRDGCQETILSCSTSLQKYPCRLYTLPGGQCKDVGEKPVTGALVPDNAAGRAVYLIQHSQVCAVEETVLWRSPLECTRKEEFGGDIRRQIMCSIRSCLVATRVEVQVGSKRRCRISDRCQE